MVSGSSDVVTGMTAITHTADRRSRIRWSKTVDADQAFDQNHFAVTEGKLLIARPPDLVSVDLASGAVRPLLTDQPHHAALGVEVDDRVIVAQAAGLILTFERRAR
ncbi:hypothetical protein GCM10029976_088000 [Kribbella albertanoniae]